VKKKIAIIGSGIAGLSSAYFLQNDFDVTLFEKNDYLGGHANTRKVQDSQGNAISIDTGFIVYNELTYPNLTKLFHQLQVPIADSDMSFSFYNPSNQFEYGGGGLRALFADPRNLINRKFYGMVKDIIKFYKTFQIGKPDPKISIRQYLESHQYSKEFIDYHFIPLISSIWSTPDQNSLDQPLSSIVSFFQNHKLFNFLNRPQWKTVQGGSRNYIDFLINDSHFDIELSSQITSIYRSPQIQIHTRNEKKTFDYLVFACPPNRFLPILMDKNADEIKLFSSFRFQSNLTQLHQNADLMPPHRAAWSSWNFHTNENQLCTLSYWMNRLQPLQTKDQFFVSLNQNQKKPLYQTVYDHPIFSMNTLQAQKDIGRIQGSQKTFYVGSYLGYGFHEDGIQSALKICQQLQIQPKGFTNPDTSRILWN
jgi:predicted NAD/FAD-binding protein